MAPPFLGVANQADIGLIHGRVDIHLLTHVGGDDEQTGCLKLGSECLSRVDQSIDYQTVHRRGDVGIGQIRLGILETGLGLVDRRMSDCQLGFQGFQVGNDLVQFGIGDEIRVLFSQLIRTLLFVLRLTQQCLDSFDLGLASSQRCFLTGHSREVEARVHLGHQLALFHLRVEVDVQFDDRPGNEGPDFDAKNRLHVPRRIDHGDDVAFFHIREPKMDLVSLLDKSSDTGIGKIDNRSQDPDDDCQLQKEFHGGNRPVSFEELGCPIPSILTQMGGSWDDRSQIGRLVSRTGGGIQ